MRIISGKYKGHHLVSFQDSTKKPTLRPTTDRVKESLFNILQNSISEARVLDLFSGTGNLGIEALSRGCHFVVFVDHNKKSMEILFRNLNKLKITNEQSDQFDVSQASVERYLKRYKGPPFDLIFADPPFTEQMAHDVMKWISESSVFGSHTLISIESGKREKLLDSYGALYRYDVRTFGDKYLSFFCKKNHQSTDHSTQSTDHSTQSTDHSTQSTDHSTQSTDHSTQSMNHSTNHPISDSKSPRKFKQRRS